MKSYDWNSGILAVSEVPENMSADFNVLGFFLPFNINNKNLIWCLKIINILFKIGFSENYYENFPY